MIWIYRVLFLPLLLVTLPYYLRRMLKRGGYARDFHHRLGFLDRVPAKTAGVKRIWIQAVSVGELLAAAPLLESLQGDAGIEVVLTTTTSTGYTLARERYNDLAAALGVFPLDFWPCSSLAWRRVDPDLVILLEGELWPEHLHQARVRDVPVLLVNARLISADDSLADLGAGPEFLAAVFDTEPGGVTAPLRVSAGLAVAAVDEALPSSIPPLDEVRDGPAAPARHQWADRLRRAKQAER